MPASHALRASKPQIARTSEGEVAWSEAGPLEPQGADPVPLVLLHGFTGHRDDFTPVFDRLARDRRVLAPDIRGHGDSDSGPGASGWSFEQLVKDLIAFLDDRGIPVCDLLGHSMGGFVALRFALARPDRLRSLILESTAPELPAALARAGFEKAAEIAEARGVDGLQQLVERVGRAESGATAARRDEEHWAHHRRRYGAMTPASYRGLGQSLFDAPSLVGRLGDVDLPCLVIVGVEDAPWLPGADLFEQNLRDVSRVTLPASEHHPHQENQTAFLAAVASHLDAMRAKAA